MSLDERTVTISVTVTLDSEGSIEEASSTLEAQGLPPDSAISLGVMAVVNYQRHLFLDQMQASDPLMNDEVRSALAGQTARLRIIDEVMHLPEAESIGMMLEL